LIYPPTPVHLKHKKSITFDDATQEEEIPQTTD
jgi:hypothetical protein